MINRSLAPPSTPQSTRLQCGITLAQERFEEIVRIAPWIWSVSSCSGKHCYIVDLKHGTCSCLDTPPEGERCKHEVTVRYIKAKTGPCAGCRKRFRHCALYLIPDDHLTFFEGDELCRKCALAYGIL